jgi:predicted Zn-dependent protease
MSYRAAEAREDMTMGSNLVFSLPLEAPLSRRALCVGGGAALLAALLPKAAAAQEPDLPRAEEERLGLIYARGFLQARGSTPTPRSRLIEAYLSQIGARLTATGLRRPLQYSYHFDPDPAFKSAMSMPGGEVVVGAGILSLVDSEDALAAVLGHEIMHVDLGHTTRRLYDLQARHQLTAAQRGRINPLEFGATHTPEQELAADLEGVRMAVAAGYSPYGVRRLLLYFQELLRPRPGQPPRGLPIERRIAQLDAQIETNHWQHLADARAPLQLPD